MSRPKRYWGLALSESIDEDQARSKTFPLKLSPQELDLLKSTAAKHDATTTFVVREALRHFLIRLGREPVNDA